MYNVIDTLIVMFCSWAACGLIYCSILGYPRKIKNSLLAVIFILEAAIIVCSSFYLVRADVCLLVCLCSFIFPFIWYEDKRPILFHICLIMAISIMNSFGEYLVEFLLMKFKCSGGVNGYIKTIYSNIFAILILLICKLRLGKKFYKFYYTRMQYFYLLVGMFFTGLLIGGVQNFMDYYPNRIKMACLAGILVCGISLIFIMGNIWQNHSIRKQTEYQLMNQTYERYIKEQEHYTKLMAQKDETLKKFRHDWNSHCAIIEGLAKESGDTGILEYLEDMKIHSMININRIYTGYSVLDAMISQMLENAQNAGITVEWSGRIKNDIDISIYDMCTIFSNLLLNAVEANEKLEDCKRLIKVSIQTYQEKLYICVRNTFDGKISKEQLTKELVTSKTDSLFR